MTVWVALSVVGGAFLTVVAVVKVVVPVCRSVRSVFRELITALHIFNGRGAFTDEVTGKQVDEVPPLGIVLAGIRSEQTKQGAQLTALTTVVQQVADQQSQINALRIDVNALQRAADERTAIRQESAAFLQTIAERDTINGEVEE